MGNPDDKSPEPGRKTLSECFGEAQERFRKAHQSASREPSSKRAEFNKFLQGTGIGDLELVCKNLGAQAEEKTNNASQLWNTLNTLKEIGDAFIDCAPESVSMVWFGISSLIQVGNAKFQTRLLICGTCDSIATIIIDCIRWEARMRLMNSDGSSPRLEIWDSDIPELIFNILDFLWCAKPHFDQSKLKRFGVTLKDLFTRELQEKVDALLEKYQEIVKITQVHFEESLLNENFRTGTKLDQIIVNVSNFTAIGSELVDAVNRQALLVELSHQRNKMMTSEAHKTYLKTLNDRLTKIINQRNGSLVASWLFNDDAYTDWKDRSNKTNTLYIKGPRGHGKSVIMMSVSRALSTEDSLLCHFFFKKGEQDIQQSRTALESLLCQLLDSDQLRNDMAALSRAVMILNPGFGDPQKDTSSSTSFLTSLESLSETIRNISDNLKQRVYLFVDALDECQDRWEQNLGKHLLSIVKDKPDGLRLIFSARSNIDVLAEVPNEGLEELRVIEITSEKNSNDLEVYLRQDVGAVLTRRINPDRFHKFFNTELARIVSIIHEKAKGDFTIARLIIASLQQPSKEPLQAKIQRLPASIGDIYMNSLESLTPDEQELVAIFLKWVVWSISGMNIIEISDHYRELYKSKSLDESTRERSQDIVENPEEVSKALALSYDADIMALIQTDPYEDPDVKDIIHHLENAGRDFFKLDRATGLVSVDISIREWIQDDPNSKSKLLNSYGFRKAHDRKGNTVFNFTFTPAFIRYGDNLNELFVKQEAHMSIALDTLTALNSVSFQEKYMVWPEVGDTTKWYTPKGVVPPPPRYEIRHWQDHIRILQNWWNGRSSLDDAWWFQLLTQISIFIRPENLQMWGVQVTSILPEYNPSRGRKTPGGFAFDSVPQKPIHVACRFGLRLLIDYIMAQPKENKDLIQPQISPARQAAFDRKFSAISLECQQYPATDIATRQLAKILGLTLTAPEELEYFLCQVTTSQDFAETLSFTIVTWMLSDLDNGFLTAWLALNKHRDIKLGWFYTILESQDMPSLRERRRLEDLSQDLEKNLEGFIDQHGKNEMLLRSKLIDLIKEHCSKNIPITPTVDTPDSFGRVPLYIAAEHPETVKCLLDYGADANKTGKCFRRSVTRGMPACSSAGTMELPLVSILHDLIYWGEKMSDKTVHSLLKSAAIILPHTANLEKIRGPRDTNLLHLAARVGDLDFFKLLCLSGQWDVHLKDKESYTAMHYLFRGRERPSDKKKVEEVMQICIMMRNMRQANHDDLVNAQNSKSQSPLALAVNEYWVEAVRLLIDLGADPHDDDIAGQNLFHTLGTNERSDEKSELEIASILYDAGVDIMKTREDGLKPLTLTLIVSEKFHLIEFFIQKYIERGYISRGNMGMLTEEGINILHRAADNPAAHMFDDPMQPFGKLMDVLLRNGIHPSDIQDLLLETNLEGNMPIDFAIDNINLHALKEILAFSPNLKSRQLPEGRTLQDRASEMLVYVMKGERLEQLTNLTTRLLKAKEIFNYILEHVPPICLSMFETALFDPTAAEEKRMWHHLKLPTITRLYDSPFRDSSGWSLVDVLLHLKREEMIDILKLSTREPSPKGTISRPSRTTRVVGSFGDLSEDGLVFNLPGLRFPDTSVKFEDEGLRKRWESSRGPAPTVKACTTILADHAVPPGEHFYFEARVSKPTSNSKYGGDCTTEEQSSQDKEKTNRHPLSIGFESLGPKSSTTFFLNYEEVVLQWTDLMTNSKKIVQDPQLQPTADTYCIGCGLDPLQNTMFQTYNGVIRNIVKLRVTARYVPMFAFSWDYKDVKINFGEEPFQFNLANNPDWAWDGSILDGFELLECANPSDTQVNDSVMTFNRWI
ncbi:hypothetical protein TWF481_006517 [Arthrobotrys musiformis]|uniref:Nephrocystin 3-like N-terminal domain-containing protein n=1 Tax=Arthrobotrys musiformis TaxID=47236 RepID=A0AAV9W8R8_9PEZI